MRLNCTALNTMLFLLPMADLVSDELTPCPKILVLIPVLSKLRSMPEDVLIKRRG